MNELNDISTRFIQIMWIPVFTVLIFTFQMDSSEWLQIFYIMVIFLVKPDRWQRLGSHVSISVIGLTLKNICSSDWACYVIVRGKRDFDVGGRSLLCKLFSFPIHGVNLLKCPQGINLNTYIWLIRTWNVFFWPWSSVNFYIHRCFYGIYMKLK